MSFGVGVAGKERGLRRAKGGGPLQSLSFFGVGERRVEADEPMVGFKGRCAAGCMGGMTGGVDRAEVQRTSGAGGKLTFAIEAQCWLNAPESASTLA